jgi:hypothetical protein
LVGVDTALSARLKPPQCPRKRFAPRQSPA